MTNEWRSSVGRPRSSWESRAEQTEETRRRQQAVAQSASIHHSIRLGRSVRWQQQPRAQANQPGRHHQPRALLGRRHCVAYPGERGRELVDQRPHPDRSLAHVRARAIAPVVRRTWQGPVEGCSPRCRVLRADAILLGRLGKRSTNTVALYTQLSKRARRGPAMAPCDDLGSVRDGPAAATHPRMNESRSGLMTFALTVSMPRWIWYKKTRRWRHSEHDKARSHTNATALSLNGGDQRVSSSYGPWKCSYRVHDDFW